MRFRSLVLCFAGLGSVLIAAAQTNPKDAASNIAGWLKMLGVDHVPGFLASARADHWVTLVGILIVFLAGGLWLWTRRVSASGAQWLPLYRAVRWIAADSVWAAEYPAERDHNWVSQVDIEFQSALSTGRLRAWGFYKPYLGDSDSGLSEIPLDYWRKAQWNSHQMVHQEPPTHVWRNSGDGGGQYRRVVVDGAEVRRLWPRRSMWAIWTGRSPIDRISKKAGGGGYKDIWRRQDEYYDRLRHRSPFGVMDSMFDSSTPSILDEADE